MYGDKVCEHNRIGMWMDSLWGGHRAYECEKNVRPSNCAGGFEEPCSGYIDCYEKGPSRRPDWSKFKYKLIPFSEMKKSESCLRQEKKEEAERKEKARKLRSQAEGLLAEARSLDEIN